MILNRLLLTDPAIKYIPGHNNMPIHILDIMTYHDGRNTSTSESTSTELETQQKVKLLLQHQVARSLVSLVEESQKQLA